jgi:hypothetical protein
MKSTISCQLIGLMAFVKKIMTGKLERFTKVTSLSHTQFNKSATYLESILWQEKILDMIRDVEDFMKVELYHAMPRSTCKLILRGHSSGRGSS